MGHVFRLLLLVAADLLLEEFGLAILLDKRDLELFPDFVQPDLLCPKHFQLGFMRELKFLDLLLILDSSGLMQMDSYFSASRRI